MISVIISSANDILLQKVKVNIAGTISVPYEIIAIDNRWGQKGICEVYNHGIKQAKYDLLCFMHEDIEIQTSGWGEIVKRLFNENASLGLIGVSGSDYKSLAPSGWNGSGKDTDYSNIIQSYKFKQQEPTHYYRNPENKKLQKVACIDGVWFCSPKDIALKVMFDENTFKGFHGYDIDFSLSIGRHYEVAVTFEILMNHYSEGKFNKAWIEDILKLHDKWFKFLPVNSAKYSLSRMISIERQTFKYFISQLILFGYPKQVAIHILNRCNMFRHLSLKLYLKLHFYIFKKYLLAKKA